MSHKPFSRITPVTFLNDCARPILEKHKILNMVLYLSYASKTSAFFVQNQWVSNLPSYFDPQIIHNTSVGIKTHTSRHNYMCDTILCGNDSIFNHLGIQLTPVFFVNIKISLLSFKLLKILILRFCNHLWRHSLL